MREVVANARKEWLTEVRSLHGLVSAAVFGLSCAVTLNLATLGQTLKSPIAAAIVVVLLVFSGLLSVPRAFIAEDEAKTMDLLILVSSPESAFLGKALVHLLLQIGSSIGVGTLFVVVSQVEVASPVAFVWVLALSTCCTVGNLSLAASLVVGAQNRWVLAAVIAMPLLVPTVFLSYPLVKWALDQGRDPSLWSYVVGLVGLSVVAWSLGPWLTEMAWKQAGRSA